MVSSISRPQGSSSPSGWRCARRWVNGQDRWQVRPATTEEARLLEIPTGTGVIHLVHNASDEDGNTLEVSESVWPADRIFVIDDYDIAQDPEDAEGLSDV